MNLNSLKRVTAAGNPIDKNLAQNRSVHDELRAKVEDRGGKFNGID